MNKPSLPRLCWLPRGELFDLIPCAHVNCPFFFPAVCTFQLAQYAAWELYIYIQYI